MSEYKAEVIRVLLASAQVCVPEDWTDEQATAFLNERHMTGLDHGWQMRHNGHEGLAGAHERVPCRERAGFVHITFEC